MQRNPQKSGGISQSQTVLGQVKPPKPPCWLDLKSSSDEGGSKHSPVSQNIPSFRTGKSGKRTRSKLHRTRSQACIEKDLPDDDLTVSLADTKPEDLGLGKVYDETIVMQETTRKCQSWLKSIEACGTKDIIDPSEQSQEEDVDIEVPDDTLWDDEPETESSHMNYSVSDYDLNVSLTGISPDIIVPLEDSTACVPDRTVFKSTREKYQLRNSDNNLYTSVMHTAMKS